MKPLSVLIPIFFFIIGVLCAAPAVASNTLFEPYLEKGIVVAQESDMAPMSFKGVDGNPKGFIIDLWRKWSAETGVPVHFYLVEWADTLTVVREGKADVHGGLFYTHERDQYLDYTTPFFPSKGGLFVKKGSDITEFSQLEGEPVGVIEGSFYERLVGDNYPEWGIVPIKTAEGLVKAADNEEIVAFLADYPTLMYQIGSMGLLKKFEVVQYHSEQEFRAAVCEGNSKMMELIETGLSLIDHNERQVIYNRWVIGDDLHPRGWLLPTVIVSVVGLLLAVLLPFFFGRRQT